MSNILYIRSKKKGESLLSKFYFRKEINVSLIKNENLNLLSFLKFNKAHFFEKYKYIFIDVEYFKDKRQGRPQFQTNYWHSILTDKEREKLVILNYNNELALEPLSKLKIKSFFKEKALEEFLENEKMLEDKLVVEKVIPFDENIEEYPDIDENPFYSEKDEDESKSEEYEDDTTDENKDEIKEEVLVDPFNNNAPLLSENENIEDNFNEINDKESEVVEASVSSAEERIEIPMSKEYQEKKESTEKEKGSEKALKEEPVKKENKTKKKITSLLKSETGSDNANQTLASESEKMKLEEKTEKEKVKVFDSPKEENSKTSFSLGLLKTKKPKRIKEEEIQEKTVFPNNLITPYIVNVVGAKAKIGTTYTSIYLAMQAQNEGYNACVVVKDEDYRYLTHKENELKFNNIISVTEKAKTREYEVIIYDLGSYDVNDNNLMDKMFHANMKVLVVSLAYPNISSQYSIERFREIENQYPVIALNFADNEDIEVFEKEYKKITQVIPVKMRTLG